MTDSVTTSHGETLTRGGRSSTTVALAWLIAAIVAGVVVPVTLDAAIPVFTLLMLVGALVVLRRSGSTEAIGLGVPALHSFAAATLAATVSMTIAFGLAEVLWHPYRELVARVAEADTPDSTFAWVVSGRHDLEAFVVYAALVTMFAEEVAFRGVLLARLRRRGPGVAIAATTLAFAALQSIAALQLSAAAAFGFLVVDTIVAVGLVGGAVAWRTGSIVPGLIGVTVANAVVVAGVT